MIWTPSQRRVVVSIVVVLFILVSLQFASNIAKVSDPPPTKAARYDELQDKIDPNTADEWALAALPSLGEKRAKEIVAYREAKRRLQPGQVVFRELNDLQRIKGIGPATAANIERYLIFNSPPSR